ncbi:MAG: HTH domain-containing protein [Betaproteobacteria bacterium]|nr:HTH domain-containing protein [Betaproteobacteria bacterium]
MDRFHRYYYLHRILSSRRLPVSRAALERELECSRATIKRIIDELRYIGAPIEYIRDQNGYRYTPGACAPGESWTILESVRDAHPAAI